jgi:hypothetical protein
VVRFVGCVGLAKFLAPGRDSYGSVWSAALKWRQMRAFSNYVSECIGVVRPCGCCPAPARFLPGSCPAAGSCPVPARFLPGSCPVPAQRPVPARFLPGSCPVPARFQPGSCPTAGQEPPRSGDSCAGAGQQPPHHSRVLDHPCADASYSIAEARFGILDEFPILEVSPFPSASYHPYIFPLFITANIYIYIGRGEIRGHQKRPRRLQVPKWP